MDKAVDQQASGSSQRASKTQPAVKWAQDVSQWAKTFFKMTEEEKNAAGICDYKKDRF